MNVLLAEDEPTSARVLCAALRRRGCAVTVVADGAEAWRRLESAHYPLVFTDWLMPEVDGLELCRRIRARSEGAYTYVILLTSQTARQRRVEGLQAGADDYLSKPVDMAELSARLEIARRILLMQQALQEQNDRLAETTHFLEQANHRFSELFQGLPVACYSCDAEGYLHEWNRAAATLFGHSPQEAVGRPLWEVLREESEETQEKNVRQRRDTIARVLAGQALTDQEIEARTRDGRRLNLLANTIPIRAADGRITGVISADIDITDRRRLQEQLFAQLRRMTALNAELEQFAYVASHDLQEPLRKIQTFSGRLEAKCGEALGPQGMAFLERIQHASGRMQALIRDLFQLTQVTKTDRPFVPVDLNVLVAEVVSDLEGRLEETGGRVEAEALPVLPGDPVQIRQLLQNLIGNGLKYHRRGIPPVVSVVAIQGTEGKGGWCRLFVRDNGIGFEEEYLDRIFAPFQRLHGLGEYEGTGIGLTICKKIVERHRGAITARSAPGEGSTFLVDLPTCHSNDD